MGVALLIAGGAVAAYLVALHPAAARESALTKKVLSADTVGLIAQTAQQGSPAGQLVQLLGPHVGPQFSPLRRAQEQAGSPEWTADLMADNSYIFIYLPTHDCLAAAGTADQPKLTLDHCDLAPEQRWRRTKAAVQVQGHEFHQYANVGDAACLTLTDELPGPVYDAGLEGCSAGPPTDQLIAFWWGSV